jgi:hypothetical protein
MKNTRYMAIEKEKKRLDAMIKSVNNQADQKLYEMHKHLERIEQKMRKDNDDHEREVNNLSKEVKRAYFNQSCNFSWKI